MRQVPSRRQALNCWKDGAFKFNGCPKHDLFLNDPNWQLDTMDVEWDCMGNPLKDEATGFPIPRETFQKPPCLSDSFLPNDMGIADQNIFGIRAKTADEVHVCACNDCMDKGVAYGTHFYKPIEVDEFNCVLGARARIPLPEVNGTLWATP